MNRFHVHVAVGDLSENVRFYSAIFGAQPSVLKDDYAKWMLDDPRVNFAISTCGQQPGVNHLGIQAESDAELETLRAGIVAAKAPLLAQKEASCCYAKSDKYWTTDPQGIAWETFHTLDQVPVYGEDAHAKGGAVPTARGSCDPVAGGNAPEDIAGDARADAAASPCCGVPVPRFGAPAAGDPSAPVKSAGCCAPHAG